MARTNKYTTATTPTPASTAPPARAGEQDLAAAVVALKDSIDRLACVADCFLDIFMETPGVGERFLGRVPGPRG
jgi:hypothetical protein